MKLDKITKENADEYMGLFDESLLENDLVDTVDLARAVLADPRFPEAVLYGSDYIRCFECNRCQYGPFTKNQCPAAIKRAKES